MALTTAAHSQLLDVLSANGGSVVNGGSVTVYGQPDDFVVTKLLPVVLNAPDPTLVGMKRYELAYPEGTQNYFCWGECWAPQVAGTHPLWYAIEPNQLNPGVQFNGFYADHKPMGIPGIATFRFIWYAMADTTDSVWVDMTFDIFEGAGLNEYEGRSGSLELYPNPAPDGMVSIDLALTGRTGREVLTIRDALGRSVIRRDIGKVERTVTMDLGALAPGVWMVSLESDGELLAARRLTVSGH